MTVADYIDRLTDFLEQYEAYVQGVLKPTQVEIKDRLCSWVEPSHWKKYQKTNRIPIPAPVKTTYSRIKRPELVVDKIFRRPNKFPEGLVPSSFRAMEDTIGVRVLVYFLSHLPLLDRELRESTQFEISQDQPPTAYLVGHQAELLGLDHLVQVAKPSGYCSVHYTLRLRESSLPPDQRPWFELQVRTLTMELWSNLEHHLGYKPSRGTHVAAKRQFRLLSKMLAVIDEHFNFLYQEMNRFQEAVTYGDNDSLTPENLPSVLSEIGVSCTQRDINNILKFLYARGVEQVHHLRQLATVDRLDMIRHTYLAVVGRLPEYLEVIASLAAVQGAKDEEDERHRIRNQIAFRGAWDSIRQEFTTQQRE
jgi:putative GTP pyrophosphokinase